MVKQAHKGQRELNKELDRTRAEMHSLIASGDPAKLTPAFRKLAKIRRLNRRVMAVTYSK